MKFTSKGQVTLPLPIRSEFLAEAGEVPLRTKRRRHGPVEAWLEESTGVSREKATTAKIMKLTRGED